MSYQEWGLFSLKGLKFFSVLTTSKVRRRGSLEFILTSLRVVPTVVKMTLKVLPTVVAQW